MDISVIIPMYNESDIIANTYDTLVSYMKNDFGEGNFEIIFVSDGSTDGSEIIIDKKNNEPDVKVISYSPNKGKGYAVKQGMLSASGDFVLFTDSDLAYGTDIIKEIYDLYKLGDCDLVIGSRSICKNGYAGYTFLRKLMSKVYLKLVSLFAGFKHTDSQAGLKGFSNKSAKEIFNLCSENGFSFDLEVLLLADKMNFKVKEIPAKVLIHKDSKVNPFQDAFKMLLELKKIKKRIKKINVKCQ